MKKYIFIKFADNPLYRVRTAFNNKEIILDFVYNYRTEAYGLTITDRFGNVLLRNKMLIEGNQYDFTTSARLLNYDAYVTLYRIPEANPNSDKWSDKYELLIIQK